MQASTANSNYFTDRLIRARVTHSAETLDTNTICSKKAAKLKAAHSKQGCNAELARLYSNIGQQVRASLCHLFWLRVSAYLVQTSSQPVGVHSEVEGPSGGGQVIAATQAGSHCQQCLLELAQVHQLPCMQAQEGLVLRETLHQGGDLFQKGFSRLFWGGGLAQDL